MKKRLIVFILIAVFVISGCEKNSDAIRVLLDWTPNTNHTGLFIAQEKGWFAEEGLNVIITQPPEDEALVLVAAERAEFAVTFQESMGPAIAKERDTLPVTAVAAIINHNTSGIMSLKESGIQRPSDLAGKKFATWDTPLVTSVMRHIVENDGGDFNTVDMIPNFATDALSALETEVDSIWGYYAWEVMAAELNGAEINFLDLGKIDNTLDFYTPVLAANTKWLADNSETAKKFLKAVSRGYNFAIENPVEAAEILLKCAPELNRELVMRSQKYLQTQYQGDASRWGEIDSERWSAFYNWMYGQGLLETNIGSDGFTNEYLP